MKMGLQDALKAQESKMRNSLSRLDGVTVHFQRIEKHGGFFTAIYSVIVPITDEEKEGEAQA